MKTTGLPSLLGLGSRAAALEMRSPDQMSRNRVDPFFFFAATWASLSSHIEGKAGPLTSELDMEFDTYFPTNQTYNGEAIFPTTIFPTTHAEAAAFILKRKLTFPQATMRATSAA